MPSHKRLAALPFQATLGFWGGGKLNGGSWVQVLQVERDSKNCQTWPKNATFLTILDTWDICGGCNTHTDSNGVKLWVKISPLFATISQPFWGRKKELQSLKMPTGKSVDDIQDRYRNQKLIISDVCMPIVTHHESRPHIGQIGTFYWRWL